MNTITLNGAVIEIPEGFRIAEMRPTEEPNDYHIRLTPEFNQAGYGDLAYLAGQQANMACQYQGALNQANLQNAYQYNNALGFYPSKQYGEMIADIARWI